MGKYIGIKMVEAYPMRASMAVSNGYKIGNSHPDDMGYVITYPDSYKSWCPADVFEKSYYHIQDENGDITLHKVFRSDKGGIACFMQRSM